MSNAIQEFIDKYRSDPLALAAEAQLQKIREIALGDSLYAKIHGLPKLIGPALAASRPAILPPIAAPTITIREDSNEIGILSASPPAASEETKPSRFGSALGAMWDGQRWVEVPSPADGTLADAIRILGLFGQCYALGQKNEHARSRAGIDNSGTTAGEYYERAMEIFRAADRVRDALAASPPAPAPLVEGST